MSGSLVLGSIRSSEKLIECRVSLLGLSYVDRLDYVSCVCQEEVFWFDSYLMCIHGGLYCILIGL